MTEPSSSPRFSFSGDSLCLDFANTWGDRARPETDTLTSYGDLLAFARQAECLSPSQLSSLAVLATADPAAAAEAFRAARELREAIYGLVAAHARRREPAATDLERLNRELRRALPHLRLATTGEGYGWRWDDADAGLEAPLRPVVRSAAELLASPDLQRVRECDGAGCTWLFFDRSRNRSRRWCAMESCGNRAKAARHYRRRRAAHTPQHAGG